MSGEDWSSEADKIFDELYGKKNADGKSAPTDSTPDVNIEDLLDRIYATESSRGKNPKAFVPNEKGAVGPFQLMPSVIEKFGVQDPLDYKSARDGAKAFLQEGLQKYNNDPVKALKYYYGGPNEKLWGEQTEAYPTKVLANTPNSWSDEADAILRGFNQKEEPTVEPVADQPVTTQTAPMSQGEHLLRVIQSAGTKGLGELADTAVAVGGRLAQGEAEGPVDPTEPTAQGGAVNYLKEKGYINFPGSEPQGLGERLLSSGVEGVASFPFAPVGAATGAMGAQAASELWPDSDLARVAGGIVGGTLGGGLAGVLRRAVSTEVNPIMGAAERIGFQPRLASTVSGDIGLTQHLGEGAGRNILAQASADEEGQVAHAVESIAGKFGSSSTYEQAGQVLQDQARNWLDKTLPTKVEAAWAPVKVAPQAPVNVGNTVKANSEIANRLGPNLPVAVKRAIDKAVLIPTWANVREARSYIGEARGVPEVVEQVGDSNLSKLYAAMTKDLEGTAKAQGLDKEFARANKESTKLYDFAQNVVGKVVESKNPLKTGITPEQAAKRVLNSGKLGDSFLSRIRNEMPVAADELAALRLRLSTGSPELAEGVINSLSPKQLSPEARTALFGKDLQSVSDLETVAKAVAPTAKAYRGAKTSPFSLKAIEYALPVAGGLGMHYGLDPYLAGATTLPLVASKGAAFAATANPLISYMAKQRPTGQWWPNALIGGTVGKMTEGLGQ